MRHVGGVSGRQRQLGAFANSGGGPGGLGSNVNADGTKSKHAPEVEHKTRLKLEVSAFTENPTWDGHVRPWREFSIGFARQMAAAGHGIVHRLGHTKTLRRSAGCLNALWEAASSCGINHSRAAWLAWAKNALLMAGQEHDGKITFHQLGINNKISGRALKQQLMAHYSTSLQRGERSHQAWSSASASC